MTAALDEPETLEWTKEQSAVINEPIDAKSLVIADAGTGKTAVLTERVAALVDSSDVAAGSEILILSFTRAAVGVLRSRLAARGGNARFASAATFDSFASRLLRSVDPGGAWIDTGYDPRIRAATARILEADGDVTELLGRFKHIFVDEIQDLVNERAELVDALLKAAPCGFTVFGDPAQAIYDYQTTTGGPDPFEVIRLRFGPTLREHALTHNFRARTDQARHVLEIGAPLSRPDPDSPKIAVALYRLARTLPGLSSPAARSATLRRVKGPTAILCRNNAQALCVSHDLREAAVPHSLRRRATDRAVASWVARSLGDVEVAMIGRKQVLKRLEAVDLPGDTAPARAWALLKRLSPRSGDGLDLRELRDRIQIGYVPDELTTQTDDLVTVSTIHRAKGLEFDTVVIVDPDNPIESQAPEEETRVLYVALTRARDNLLTMPFDFDGILRLDKDLDRWVVGGWQKWQTFGFEIRGDDTDRHDPPGTHSQSKLTPGELQDHLWNSVTPGDAVHLELIQAPRIGFGVPTYAVVHDDIHIGVTSGSFGDAFKRRLHPRGTGRWPEVIDRLYIESVDTVAGATASAERAGLTGSGLWLRPRVVGLGKINW